MVRLLVAQSLVYEKDPTRRGPGDSRPPRKLG